jgi:DNA-directed RNA polymerase specialized sigma24 family protein
MDAGTLPVPDGYLANIARNLTSDYAKQEDLIQEGRIEVWTVSQKKPGMPRAYYGKAAKYRMLEILFGKRRPVGAETSKGRHHHDITDLHPASLDADRDNGETLADLAYRDDQMEGVELAYHHNEIIAAILKLPEKERRYIYDRFWKGKAAQELPRLWQQIRPKLTQELAHLSDVI